MAVAVPVVTAIGGGSLAAGTVITAAALTSAAVGVAGARAERVAGKNAEAQANIDANAEGDAARQREILRKRDLLRAISSQQARAGAAGINFAEGSPAAIARLDIDDANRDIAIDSSSSKQRQRSLRAQGRAARFIGNTRSTMALVDTAANAAKTFASGLR